MIAGDSWLPEPLRRGVEGVKGQGPVNILCHKILLTAIHLIVHFYGNSSALKGHLQEPMTLMTVLMSETQPSY